MPRNSPIKDQDVQFPDAMDAWLDEHGIYSAPTGQDVDLDNLRSARRALDALRSYSPDDSISIEDAAIDFLADLHHLTDLLGISFNHTVDYHHRRYRHEIWDDCD